MNPPEEAPKMNLMVTLKAARNMDWQQVVLNGGPPCFHMEKGKFCGRAERWQGHGVRGHHLFVSLAQLLEDAYEAP